MNKKLAGILCLFLTYSSLVFGADGAVVFGGGRAVIASGAIIKLISGVSAPMVPKQGGATGDTVTVKLYFEVTRKGSLAAEFKLVLKNIVGSHIHPVLLDPLPFKDDELRKKGKDSATVHILVAHLTCLADQESFSIIVNGQDSAAYKVIVDSFNTVVTGAPFSMSLVGDTTDLAPRIKGGNVGDPQAFSIFVELAGKVPAAPSPLYLVIPPFQARSLPSHPVLAGSDSPLVRMDSLKGTNGCPVRVRVPVLVSLTPVDSAPQPQTFYIQQKDHPDTVSFVVVGTGGTAGSAKKAATAVVAPAPADSAYIFTFACAAPATSFMVLLDPDSTGKPKTIRVVPQGTKDTGVYHFHNIYDPADAATWLVAQFKGVKQDCANYFAYRTGEELKLLAVTGIRGLGVAAPAVVPPPAADKAGAAPAGDKAGAGAGKPAAKAGVAPIRLDDSTTTLHPVYNKKDSAIHTIDLLVYRDSLPASLPDNDSLQFVLDKYTLPKPKNAKDSFFIFSRKGDLVVLPKKSWFQPDSGKLFQARVRLYFNNPLVDSIHDDDRFGNIRLKGDDTSFHALRLTERGMYNPSAPFWVDLGTNFDLLDGVKLNNLYGGIYGYVKDIAGWHPFKEYATKAERKQHYNLSFLGGVYEAKSTSSSLTTDSGLLYRGPGSFKPITGKGYPIFHDTGVVNNNLTVTSLGIFFSPQLRLTDGPADGNGFHMFLSLYVELLWQKVASNFDFSGTGRYDTAYVGDSAAVYNVNQKPGSTNFDFRCNYFGVGIPILIKDKIFTMYVNNAFGVTNQKFVFISDSSWVHTGGFRVPPRPVAGTGLPQNTGALTNLIGFQQPKRTWNAFALVQFRLNEEKYGISFTGEVRSMLMRSAKPVVSLALSKKFDLSDLFNTIVKPFTPGGTSAPTP